MEDNEKATQLISKLSYEELGQNVTKVVSAAYLQLMHRFGAKANEDNRFLLSLVHTLANIAVGMKLDYNGASPDTQMEQYVQSRSMTVVNMQLLEQLRSGVPPEQSRIAISAEVNGFLNGDYYNPFQRNVALLSPLHKGLVMYFAGRQGEGIKVIMEAVEQGYKMFNTGDLHPVSAFGIDDIFAARIIYALIPEVVAISDTAKAGERAYYVNIAGNVLAVITATMYASKGAAADQSTKTIFPAMAQIWGHITNDLMPESNLPVIKQIQDNAHMINPPEQKLMLQTLLGQPTLLSNVIRELGKIDTSAEQPTATKELAVAVRDASIAYWDSEKRVRKVSH